MPQGRARGPVARRPYAMYAGCFPRFPLPPEIVVPHLPVVLLLS
jgi:hypothetical protein